MSDQPEAGPTPAGPTPAEPTPAEPTPAESRAGGPQAAAQAHGHVRTEGETSVDDALGTADDPG